MLHRKLIGLLFDHFFAEQFTDQIGAEAALRSKLTWSAFGIDIMTIWIYIVYHKIQEAWLCKVILNCKLENGEIPWG